MPYKDYEKQKEYQLKWLKAKIERLGKESDFYLSLLKTKQKYRNSKKGKKKQKQTQHEYYIKNKNHIFDVENKRKRTQRKDISKFKNMINTIKTINAVESGL